MTRLNGTKLVINSDLIETIEETPDTVITFANARRMVVAESAREVVKRITRYRRQVFMLEPP